MMTSMSMTINMNLVEHDITIGNNKYFIVILLLF